MSINELSRGETVARMGLPRPVPTLVLGAAAWGLVYGVTVGCLNVLRLVGL